MGEAWRIFALFVVHAGGITRIELRVPRFARVLKWRDGDEYEALIASFIDAHGVPH